jgi:hypothetical protein
VGIDFFLFFFEREEGWGLIGVGGWTGVSCFVVGVVGLLCFFCNEKWSPPSKTSENGSIHSEERKKIFEELVDHRRIIVCKIACYHRW